MRQPKCNYDIPEVTSVLDTGEAARYLGTTVVNMNMMRYRKVGPAHVMATVADRPYYMYKVKDLDEWKASKKKRKVQKWNTK